MPDVAPRARTLHNPRMRTSILVLSVLALLPARAISQTPDLGGSLRWRTIGPFRAGRARALAATPGQPTVFYIGFDNGGLWRSSDYGSSWEPLFDHESTGSIGAVAVAASAPNVIYVGSGAGIIRPDLATGNGMYRSNDTGRTWTHLGLDETQMIAYVDVDSKNPDRLFVAALGHPYGPNAERGVYRSSDGGHTFEKVLYKDEYTSANEVRIDPSNHRIVYAALWQQQSTFYEYAAFGPDSTSPGAGGIYKSTDGGTTWAQLTNGLPPVLEANIAIAPSNPQVIYAMIAAVNPAGGSGPVGLYKSSDGGAHWTLRTRIPGVAGPQGDTSATADPRPLGRIGGGDLPRLDRDVAQRRRRRQLVGSARLAGRRRLSAHLDPSGRSQPDPCGVRSGCGHLVQSRRVMEQLVHATDRRRLSCDGRQRVPVSRLQRAAGLGVDLRCEPIGRRRDHLPRLAPGQHPGVRHCRARSARSRCGVRQRTPRRVALRPAQRPDRAGGP